MARNDTQFYDASQDEDELVRLELDGEVYEMPRSVAAQASQEFEGAGLTPGGQTRMTADEFYDEPPAKPAARPARAKPRAAAPVDMDLMNDPEALAGGGEDAGMRQAFQGAEPDWVDALAAGPSADMDFTGSPMDVPRDDEQPDRSRPGRLMPGGGRELWYGGPEAIPENTPLAASVRAAQNGQDPEAAWRAAGGRRDAPDAMGRDVMHRALGNAVPQGVERMPTGALPQAWSAHTGRPMPNPPPGGPGPYGPSGDPVGRSMMHDALGAGSVPSRTRTISDPIAGGFPEAWEQARSHVEPPVARAMPAGAAAPPPMPQGGGAAPPPAPMNLEEDPEAIEALAAGPGPAAPPAAAPQYDMIVQPGADELDAIRRRLAGFRMGAQ